MYRTGDLTHEALGDVEVECETCDGTGRIEVGRVGAHWNFTTEACPDCHGAGTLWKEGP